MLVHCKLHRYGGTVVTFGKGRESVDYHFKPADPKAPLDDIKQDHVCEVEDPEHLARFLSISDAYQIHGSVAGKKVAPKAAAPAAAGAADGDDTGDEGDGAPAGDTKLTARRSGDEDEVDAAAAARATVEKMSKAELVAYIKSKTGKNPSPATSLDKLREKALTL